MRFEKDGVGDGVGGVIQIVHFRNFNCEYIETCWSRQIAIADVR